MTTPSSRRRSGRRHGRGAPARRGFTIVEVIAAVVILGVGVLGLAGTAAVVTRLMSQGDQQTTAAVVAQRRFERLRATRCPAGSPLVSGTASANGMSERWTVVRQVGVQGLRLFEVTDSVSYKTSNGARGHLYRSIVECLP
ncbi:MAG TPA: prepilin-type N-terminal cleavage/methylation domain-containing protein [Gemmatimonadaceae bacterium]|nr:prepilin-type N-terminal cleavage/methylation domain-containing protein [Gemmatimonadaceae bacterium]